MKASFRVLVSAALVALTSAANSQALLTGDPKLACEAIMCLSSGSPPHECQESLYRFFSINLSKPAQTVAARINFLNQCPLKMPGATGTGSNDNGQSGSSSSGQK